MPAKDYETFADGELFIVRWRDPNEEAAAALSAQLEQHHAKLGAKLFFVVLIGADCTSPDKNTRELLLEGHDRIYALTHTVRGVIIGQGFRQTVLRTGITAMMLVAGLRGQPFSMHKTIPELMAAIPSSSRSDSAELLRTLLDSGIISAEEAEL